MSGYRFGYWSSEQRRFAGVASQNDVRRMRRQPQPLRPLSFPSRYWKTASFVCSQLRILGDPAVGRLLALHKRGLVAPREKVSPQPVPRVEPGPKDILTYGGIVV
jgi:hypothetical protein